MDTKVFSSKLPRNITLNKEDFSVIFPNQIPKRYVYNFKERKPYIVVDSARKAQYLVDRFPDLYREKHEKIGFKNIERFKKDKE